ncbi:MAG: NAD(P)/FAD-dependent oxidoreductase [Fimbriimonadales bacterium]|nr:NAD(P)/FAD-dependent oxidoreductase [Fimbriimonadales bacterium]
MSFERRFDYLLLGGGTSCGYCAAAIRDIDKNRTIAIVSADSEPPYDRPPFSKGFLKNDAMSPDDAHCKDESFYPENNIELFLQTPIASVHRGSKKVVAANGDEFAYGKLLYALGAEPIPLSIPGGEHAQLLRTASDGLAIRERAKSSKKICVVGGGWIGAEVAATLQSMGIAVTLIEKMPDLWPNVPSRASASAVKRELEKNGVEVIVGNQVAAIDSKSVRLENGNVIDCDFVIAGIGDTPRTHIAREAGLDVGARGIRANSNLVTSDQSIWTSGDVCEAEDIYLGKHYQAEHHLHAKATGAHAGKGMAGEPAPFDGVPYFFSDVGELSYIQRGYPEHAKESFVLGDPESPVLTEVFLFQDGRFAGGSDIRRDYKQQDPISDLFEALIKARTNIGALRDRLQSPSFDVLELKSLL